MKTKTLNTVIAQSTRAQLPIAGLTVAQMRRKFRKRIALDFPHMVPVLNGKRTSWTRKIKPGDVLMFIQAHGDYSPHPGKA